MKVVLKNINTYHISSWNICIYNQIVIDIVIQKHSEHNFAFLY